MHKYTVAIKCIHFRLDNKTIEIDFPFIRLYLGNYSIETKYIHMKK